MRRRTVVATKVGGDILAALVVVVLCASSTSAAVCNSSGFSCPPTGSCVITGTWNVGSDCVLDFGSRSVELRGVFQADTLGGSFTVLAKDLTLNGGKLRSLGNTFESGGDIVVELTGAFQMTGSGPRVDTSGNGGGGNIWVQAHGVTLAGTLLADGGVGDSCGDAGVIQIDAQDGALVSTANVHSVTGGHDCVGGIVELSGAGITSGGDIDARGGASASEEAISLYASAGNIDIVNNSVIRADGTGQPDGDGADGGEISLVAAAGHVSTGTGLVSASGRAPNGAAGALSIYSGQAVSIDAQVTIRGGGDGIGGDVLVDASGDVNVNASIQTSGGENYPFGTGGTIQIRTDGALTIASDLQSGGATAGAIALTGNPVTVSADVLAHSSRGDGGLIEIDSCHAFITGQLDAGASNGGTGGTIEINAGAVTAGATALIETVPCSGPQCIVVTTRPGSLSIDPAADLVPAPTFLTDPALPLC